MTAKVIKLFPGVRCELRVYDEDGSLWQAVPFDMVKGTNAKEVVTKQTVRLENVFRIAIWHPEHGEFVIRETMPVRLGGQITMHAGSLEFRSGQD